MTIIRIVDHNWSRLICATLTQIFYLNPHFRKLKDRVQNSTSWRLVASIEDVWLPAHRKVEAEQTTFESVLKGRRVTKPVCLHVCDLQGSHVPRTGTEERTPVHGFQRAAHETSSQNSWGASRTEHHGHAGCKSAQYAGADQFLYEHLSAMLKS